MAARTHSYTQAPSSRRRSTTRAALALVFGLAAAIAVPLAIELTRTVSGADLLDAVWAIPVAAVGAALSFMVGRGVRGSRLLQTARVLAVTGMCFALSSALAVGIYEFLVWKENTKPT